MVEGDRTIGPAAGLKGEDGPKVTRGEVLRPIDQDPPDVLEVLRKKGPCFRYSLELLLVCGPVLGGRSQVPLPENISGEVIDREHLEGVGFSVFFKEMHKSSLKQITSNFPFSESSRE